MMPTDRAKRSKSSIAVRRWERLANIQLPVIGGWAQRTAANQLIMLAQNGDRAAMRLCAKFFILYDDPEIRSSIRNLFINLRSSSMVDDFWDVYASSHRPAILRELMVELDQPAKQPPELRTLSLLVLNKKNLNRLINEDLIPALVIKCEDKDSWISERAKSTLLSLKKQDAINALCKLWIVTRDLPIAAIISQAQYQPTDPLRARVLVALFTNHPECLSQVIKDSVPILVDALQDADSTIQKNARFVLSSLLSQEAVDLLCQIWAETRRPDLEEIITAAKFSASAPLNLRLLTLAKNGMPIPSETITADAVKSLLSMLDDPDPVIQASCQTALLNLQNRSSIDAYCREALDQNHTRALKIAVDAGYFPDKVEDRVLFYYLTGQYVKYDALDFDLRIMRALYTAADPELRKRISRKIQSAGRKNDLEILSSSKTKASRPPLNCDEADLLVDIHVSHQNWLQLWNLVFDLPVTCAVRAICELLRSGWVPEQDETFFNELRQIIGAFNSEYEPPVFPVMAQISQIRVSGRINDLCFSPNNTILTIASGNRSIVCWDYQQAAIVARTGSQEHSAYRVINLPSGEIIWGERAGKKQDACAVMLWDQENTRKLTHHSGSVTAMLMVGDHHLITCGSDNRVCRINIQDASDYQELNLMRTFRAACCSTDTKQLYLIDQSLHSIRLEDFSTGGRLISYPLKIRNASKSTAQICMTDSKGRIWVGFSNGQVLICSQNTNRESMQLRPLTKNGGKCTGMVSIQKPSVFATAWLDGELNVFNEQLDCITSIETPWKNITSLHASLDGAFLALGSRENGISLWDLRITDFSKNWNLPISMQSSGWITLLDQWHAATNVPSQSRKWVRLIQSCLQYYYRYEVQIDLLPHVKPGAYDIFL